MPLDPRTPVLVGVGAVTRRPGDPNAAVEAVDLMVAAARAADADTGAAGLVVHTTLISVPEGTWSYPDPGRLIAERLGVRDQDRLRTVVGAVGVTQQAVIADACQQISGGHTEVALVVGGEARCRAVEARAAGMEAGESTQVAGARPDRRLEPISLGIADIEMIRNAVTPATAYALMHQAHRHHRGVGLAQDRRELAERAASMSSVAADNPDAWDRTRYRPDDIIDTSISNRMVAWPYTKRLCSQWNVDQAAALLICSYGAARDAGVPNDRMVFPRSSSVSDHAVPVIARPELWRSPNVDAALAAALSDADVDHIDDVAHIDIYSCFPLAVAMGSDAVDLSPDRAVTVTGGMSFAGGPLNNYVLNAMVTLARRLRDDPAAFGLSTSISGFMTKAGAGVWSATPPSGTLVIHDCTSAVEAAAVGGGAPRVVDADYVGPATVVAWTVEFAGGDPSRAVVFVDTPDGARTMASSGAPEACAVMCRDEWIGATVRIAEDGSFRV